MNVALSLAYRGLTTAIDQHAMIAQKISKLSMPDNDIDLVKETVDQIKTKQAFSANIQVAKTSNEMLGSIIDLVG